MIELYVIMTLLGAGYVINQQSKPNQKMKDAKMPPNFKPTATNTYSSDMQRMVKQVEASKARAAFTKSLQKTGNVINPALVSTLAGKDVSKQDFKHNNMVPFFKGSINQNFQRDGNKGIMERFMGAPDELVPQKRERAPLFQVQRDVYNCNGAPLKTDFIRDRVVEPTLKNSVRPFEQVQVGPGLGKGFDDKPTGGYQQFESQEYAMPKTVDELRVASKPKTTFDARTVEGQKGSRPGKVGRVDKNRVDTYYENNSDRYFKTTGANLKETQPGVYDAKYTNRLDTTGEYTGTAFNNREQTVRDSKVQPTNRMQLDPFEPTAPNLSSIGRQDKVDYGKGNILVYSNERDITTERTYQGNITSLVKALIAPIEDMVKISRKEYTIDNPRPNGQLQPQVPSKQPVMDPNNVMRTTIKETTIHDTQPANLKGPSRITVYDPNEVARVTVKQTTIDKDSMLNLRGPNKNTVYDPNNVARTTIKETNLHDADTLNLKGPSKNVVYDPNNVTRTTIKETNLHDADTLNLKSHIKSTVYDPNDIARTTLKETMLHDAEYTNLKGERTANAVYMDENARTTVRETTAPVDTELNVNGGRRVGVAYDPDQNARTTIKETTQDADREGNPNALERFNAAYMDAQYDAPITQKEIISEIDYYGQPARENGDGYQVLDIDMPITQKEIVSDIEYYGHGNDKTQFKQTSYEDMMNVCTDDLKEETLMGREPTQTGVKLVSGSDNVKMEIRRSQFEIEQGNKDRITNRLAVIGEDQITRMRSDMAVDQIDRLDDALLEAFKKNPFTQSLNSFA